MGADQFWGEFGPVLVVIASCALLVAGIAMLFNCIQSSRFLRSYRQDLNQRIGGLRIHRMLEALGVSGGSYMRKAAFSEVETHLSRCQQCPNTPECDAALEQGDTSNGEAFCSNFRELVKFSRRPRGVTSRRAPAADGSG